MKILFTPVRFYPFLGGVEHSSYHLAKSLVELGNEVEVVCADEGPGKPSENIDGVVVKRLPYKRKVANTNITWMLPKYLVKEKFDVIQTYMPTPWSADWSILISKLRRKKSVIYIKNDISHSGLIPSLFNFIYRNTVFRFSLALVDKIFIVNQEWEKVFVKTGNIFEHYKNKVLVIPNGIDTEKFSPQKVKRKKNEILFVSVFSKYHGYKGLDDLLTALQLIKEKIPDITLKIAGDGELRPFYENMVNKMGLKESVNFIGKFDQRKLAKIYSSSAIFCLPSKGLEGHANAVLEALACGTPVVVSDVVGMATDIEKYKCGRVVLPEQPKQIASEIIKILTDDKLRAQMSVNAVDLINKKYDWVVVAKRVEREYKKLLGVQK